MALTPEKKKQYELKVLAERLFESKMIYTTSLKSISEKNYTKGLWQKPK
jgi:hypothetical protein